MCLFLLRLGDDNRLVFDEMKHNASPTCLDSHCDCVEIVWQLLSLDHFRGRERERWRERECAGFSSTLFSLAQMKATVFPAGMRRATIKTTSFANLRAGQ